MILLTGFVAAYIFMLAAFTGYEIIGRVPVILHTPLMSGSTSCTASCWSAPWWRWATPTGLERRSSASSACF